MWWGCRLAFCTVRPCPYSTLYFMLLDPRRHGLDRRPRADGPVESCARRPAAVASARLLAGWARWGERMTDDTREAAIRRNCLDEYLHEVPAAAVDFVKKTLVDLFACLEFPIFGTCPEDIYAFASSIGAAQLPESQWARERRPDTPADLGSYPGPRRDQTGLRGCRRVRSMWHAGRTTRLPGKNVILVDPRSTGASLPSHA
jgi:hypothetical protein